MEKSKFKGHPKTFYQYFVDEFILFRRDFFYEAHLAPEILAQKLDNSDYEFKGIGQRERRIQAHVAKVDNKWHFEMIAEQPVSGKNRKYTPDNSGYRPSANVSGIIYADDDGKTFVEGSVVVNGLILWLGFGVAFFFILLFSVFLKSLGISFFDFYTICIIFALGMGFLWFQMYRDRNHLASLVEQAIKSANERIYE